MAFACFQSLVASGRSAGGKSIAMIAVDAYDLADAFATQMKHERKP
jgi:hypothetical protein